MATRVALHLLVGTVYAVLPSFLMFICIQRAIALFRAASYCQLEEAKRNLGRRTANMEDMATTNSTSNMMKTQK